MAVKTFAADLDTNLIDGHTYPHFVYTFSTQAADLDTNLIDGHASFSIARTRAFCRRP